MCVRHSKRLLEVPILNARDVEAIYTGFKFLNALPGVFYKGRGLLQRHEMLLMLITKGASQ